MEHAESLHHRLPLFQFSQNKPLPPLFSWKKVFFPLLSIEKKVLSPLCGLSRPGYSINLIGPLHVCVDYLSEENWSFWRYFVNEPACESDVKPSPCEIKISNYKGSDTSGKWYTLSTEFCRLKRGSTTVEGQLGSMCISMSVWFFFRSQSNRCRESEKFRPSFGSWSVGRKWPKLSKI